MPGCFSSHALGAYDVATDTKHRKPASPQNMGEDKVLDPRKRAKTIGASRDAIRNFSVAAWAVRKHLDFVTMFDFHVRTEDKTFNQEVEGLIEEWKRPANCDIAGKHHFDRFLRMAESRRVVDGDIGIIKLRGRHLQAIESDRIRQPDNRDRRKDRERWTHGVKKNKAGRHLAYSIWKRGVSGRGYEFEKTIPAGNMMLHGFYDFFDQTRGISPITSSINTFGDIMTGLNLALIKAKISQLFALLITRGDGEGFAQKDENDEYVVNFGAGPMMLDLDEGDTAEFLESKNPSSEFQDYMELSIAIALKALDIPYSFYNESFTNFFGSRAAWMHYERSCISKRKDVAELLRQITVFLLTSWIVEGKLKLPRGMTLATMPFHWVPVGMPWWKPSEEIRGDLDAIAAALTTPQDVVRKRGQGDFFDNVDKIKTAKEYAEQAGVSLSWVIQNATGNEPTKSNFSDRLGDIETAIADLRERGLIDD